jgi:AcrR family transcriptional regulator
VSTSQVRLPAAERRQAIVDAALRVFAGGSYSGATTAEIARAAGISEPILYRHFASKRELYLACLDAVWERVRALWNKALEREEEPSNWLRAIGKAYLEERGAARIVMVDLWIQALTEAADDAEIRRALRAQLREVHNFVADVIRRAQAGGGIVADRDADAEAWIFISLGLLSTIDRRLGNLVGEQFDDIVASRRAWMTGT